jgi:hypothetical protein
MLTYVPSLGMTSLTVSVGDTIVGVWSVGKEDAKNVGELI